jgi:hypothetical protein
MSKYAKGISAVVAAILGVGVTALIPGISPELATSLTGLLTVLAVIFGPANEGPKPDMPVRPGPDEPTYLSN